MIEFAQGNEQFQEIYFKNNSEDLLRLVKMGQQPKALFIGCSDSRVIPDLIVQSKPGDLFVIRNIGNFVPPYKVDEDFHSTASGIEYAINILGVSEIIVCGHTHCGAIASLYNTLDNPNLKLIKKWLELGEKPKQLALLSLGVNPDEEELLRLTEKFSIITQMDNLITYPYIKEKIDNNELSIHGWYYDIETGKINYYNNQTHQFAPLADLS
jgi:carbonic anhydrase